jgi:hypothetical protein
MTSLAAAAEPEAPPRLRLIVPAYFYPAGDGAREWQRLFDAAAKVPVVAIVNPASGPGEKADPNYLKLFDRPRRSSPVLIGYVATSYARRPLAEVKADVDRWIALYPGIEGIFFDQQASGADAIDYYAALYKYVRTERKLRLVMNNPGTTCTEEFFARPALDGGNVFEGARPADGLPVPSWGARILGRASVLVYKVPTAAAMQACVKEAIEKKVGNVFVTDGELPNPWDHLPKYWEAEVAAVREANAGP